MTIKITGWQDGSVSKCTCCQTWSPVFKSQYSDNGRKKNTHKSPSDTCATHMYVDAYMHVHAHTHKRTHTTLNWWKKLKFQFNWILMLLCWVTFVQKFEEFIRFNHVCNSLQNSYLKEGKDTHNSKIKFESLTQCTTKKGSIFTWNLNSSKTFVFI